MSLIFKGMFAIVFILSLNSENWSFSEVSYQAEPAWKGNPCSRTPPWCPRCSPSTGWSSSWRLSARWFPPRRRSSTRWEEWSTPGSSHTGSTRSSLSPCTSPSSCASWWALPREHEQSGSVKNGEERAASRCGKQHCALPLRGIADVWLLSHFISPMVLPSKHPQCSQRDDVTLGRLFLFRNICFCLHTPLTLLWACLNLKHRTVLPQAGLTHLVEAQDRNKHIELLLLNMLIYNCILISYKETF